MHFRFLDWNGTSELTGPTEHVRYHKFINSDSWLHLHYKIGSIFFWFCFMQWSSTFWSYEKTRENARLPFFLVSNSTRLRIASESYWSYFDLRIGFPVVECMRWVRILILDLAVWSGMNYCPVSKSKYKLPSAWKSGIS